ncbi:MAG: hypothetical protein H7322_11395 [Ramlibacter sp.]|nr:hypothetical protein [Ramlibacter sp.]
MAQAVRAAMDCGGVPFQLIWPREEDQTHDSYRPMQTVMLRASFEQDGLVSSLHIEPAGDVISPRWLSAALHGRIDIKQGAIEQTNFPTDLAMKVARALSVKTWLVPSHLPLGGVG